MLVHFTSSKTLLLEDINLPYRITQCIQKNYTLVHNWIAPLYQQIRKTGSMTNSPDAYRQSLEDLAKADVLIADVTYSSFGVGYLVSTAIQQKKPTLLLSKQGIENNSLVKFLDNAVVELHEYNDANLEQIINTFLAANDLQPKDLRFNFFVDRQIYNYLRWAALKSGKTKARILRELVLKEIEKH